MILSYNFTDKLLRKFQGKFLLDSQNWNEVSYCSYIIDSWSFPCLYVINSSN